MDLQLKIQNLRTTVLERDNEDIKLQLNSLTESIKHLTVLVEGLVLQSSHNIPVIPPRLPLRYPPIQPHTTRYIEQVEEVEAGQGIRVPRHYVQDDKYSNNQGSEEDKADEDYQRDEEHALDSKLEELPPKFYDNPLDYPTMCVVDFSPFRDA